MFAEFSSNFFTFPGQFVEDFCSGEEGGRWQKMTPTVCVGGAAVRGRSIFGGLLKDLVRKLVEVVVGS